MIDERLPNVSYHVRALLELGCVELVSTAQRRGAIEHYYRAVVRPFFRDRDWKKLPQSGPPGGLRRRAPDDLGGRLLRDQGGTFEGAPRPSPVAQRARARRGGLEGAERSCWGVLEETEKIESRSAERLKEEDREAVPVRVVLMHFESPTPEPKAKRLRGRSCSGVLEQNPALTGTTHESFPVRDFVRGQDGECASWPRTASPSTGTRWRGRSGSARSSSWWAGGGRQGGARRDRRGGARRGRDRQDAHRPVGRAGPERGGARRPAHARGAARGGGGSARGVRRARGRRGRLPDEGRADARELCDAITAVARGRTVLAPSSRPGWRTRSGCARRATGP